MRKILTLLVAVFFFVAAHSQITYPKFSVDSCGQKVVVMTVHQAQALDNKTDLLVLFEKLNGEIGSYDSVCLKVVNQKDSVILSQDIQIKNLKEDISVKDSTILKLKKALADTEAKVVSYKSELNNKNAEIALHLDEMKKAKKRAFWTGGGIGVVVGILVKILIK